MSSGFRVQADVCLSEKHIDGWKDKLLLSTIHCQLFGILWASNSSYAMHHTFVKACRRTKNLKLLHPHSNWILNPSFTERLIFNAQGHGIIKQQCHKLCIYSSYLVKQIYILNYTHYQMDMDFILLLTTALCMNMFNVEKYFVSIIILCIQFEKGV
jgi:hypothetical protein